MTREAKIGMLTGLGVIVLIGVLLSQYLGDKNVGPSGAGGATGRMAVLPVGEGYRQQVLAPVAVPAMTPAGGGERMRLAGGVEVASPIATGGAGAGGAGAGGGGVPAALAAADAGGGPSVAGPVVPVAAGPTLMDGRSEGGPPIIMADLTVPVKMTDGAARAAAGAQGAQGATATTATTYTIVAGDTLAKIAKKYYNSTKNSDVARIVAANPGVLKDAGTMLVVGKKLVIPNAPPTTPAVAAPAVRPLAVAPGAAADTGLVPMPGGSRTDLVVPSMIQPPAGGGAAAAGGVGAAAVGPTAVPTAAKTYVVQAGDTLEKIARKLAPTKITETVAKLTSLNAIKDPTKLKVGQALKLPV